MLTESDRKKIEASVENMLEAAEIQNQKLLEVSKAKPDPIKLGEELAKYKRQQETNLPDITFYCDNHSAIYSLVMERDFWRNKVLNP